MGYLKVRQPDPLTQSRDSVHGTPEYEGSPKFNITVKTTNFTLFNIQVTKYAPAEITYVKCRYVLGHL